MALTLRWCMTLHCNASKYKQWDISPVTSRVGELQHGQSALAAAQAQVPPVVGVHRQGPQPIRSAHLLLPQNAAACRSATSFSV
jgi:hypothetical protein